MSYRFDVVSVDNQFDRPGIGTWRDAYLAAHIAVDRSRGFSDRSCSTQSATRGKTGSTSKGAGPRCWSDGNADDVPVDEADRRRQQSERACARSSADQRVRRDRCWFRALLRRDPPCLSSAWTLESWIERDLRAWNYRIVWREFRRCKRLTLFRGWRPGISQLYAKRNIAIVRGEGNYLFDSDGKATSTP